MPHTATRHGTTGQAANYTDAERRYIHDGGQLFVEAHPKLTTDQGEAIARDWLEFDRRAIAKGRGVPEGYADLDYLAETINDMDAGDIEACLDTVEVE